MLPGWCVRAVAHAFRREREIERERERETEAERERDRVSLCEREKESTKCPHTRLADSYNDTRLPGKGGFQIL